MIDKNNRKFRQNYNTKSIVIYFYLLALYILILLISIAFFYSRMNIHMKEQHLEKNYDYYMLITHC